MNLVTAVQHPRWTPRSKFPPSNSIGNDVFACTAGIYLVVNPDFGGGDPVRAVGWAESDYWASRVWAVPPFRGELIPPPNQWGSPPSLAFLGRPEDLSFATVLEFEQEQEKARRETLVTVNYRMTDGAALCCSLAGAGGVTYYFGSSNPKPTDLPIAYELQLEESK